MIARCPNCDQFLEVSLTKASMYQRPPEQRRVVSPGKPRCSEFSVTTGKPCIRPVARDFGLCSSHFYYYFGHKFPWPVYEPCMYCGVGKTDRSTEERCLGRPLKDRARQLLAEFEVPA